MIGVNLSVEIGRAVNICLQCGEVLKCHVAVCDREGWPMEAPRPGAASVCFECYAVGVWSDDLSLRAVEADEMAGWHFETRELIESMRKMLDGLRTGRFVVTRLSDEPREDVPEESRPTALMVPVRFKQRGGHN